MTSVKLFWCDEHNTCSGITLSKERGKAREGEERRGGQHFSSGQVRPVWPVWRLGPSVVVVVGPCSPAECGSCGTPDIGLSSRSWARSRSHTATSPPAFRPLTPPCATPRRGRRATDSSARHTWSHSSTRNTHDHPCLQRSTWTTTHAAENVAALQRSGQSFLWDTIITRNVGVLVITTIGSERAVSFPLRS